MPVGLSFDVTYEGAVLGGNIDGAAFNRMTTRTFRDVGYFWHEQFRMGHFEESAKRKYGYAPRKGEASGTAGKAFWRSYTGRKKKAKGHTLALVWSEETRERVRRQRRRAKATPSYVDIFINAPRLNIRPRGGNIKMADEMRAVSRDERGQMEGRFVGRLEKRMKRASGRKRRKIG